MVSRSDYGDKQDMIKLSIDAYIHKLVNWGMDDKSILYGVSFVQCYLDNLNAQRIYCFKSIPDNKEYAIAITTERRETMSATCLPLKSFPPTEPIPPTNYTINEEFSLGLFAKCKLCGNKHLKISFKLNYNNEYVCKKCCKDYDIGDIEKYKVVKQIRKEIKNNMRGD